MKKIISLILSIALLATLMPAMLVNADDVADTQTIMITEDTTLTARNINNSGYGKYVGGNDNLLLWSKRDSANVGYLLHKIPLSGITVPAGKKIAKVEFSFSPTYDPAKASSYSFAGQYDNAPVCFYVADSDWDESTTNMFAWCTDKNGGTIKTPELTWADSKYGAIAAQADSTCTVSMAAMSASELSQKLTFDITSLYEKAIASNMLDANGNFSVLTRVGQDNTGGWTTYVASAEHTDASFRPSITVTFEDVQQDDNEGGALVDPVRPITEDTFITARNINNSGYGVYVGGSDAFLLWSKRDSANGAYLLHKLPVGGLDKVTVPEGSKLKIELHFSMAYDSTRPGWQSGAASDLPVHFYIADSDWDESTTNMYAWCTDKNGGTIKTPELTWADSKYGAIAATPDLSCIENFNALSESEPSQSFSFDITSLYEKALTSGMIDKDGNLSVLTRAGADNTGGWSKFIASAEHADETLRPYIEISFEPIITFEASEVLVVDSAADYDVAGFESAAGLESVSKDDSIKAICKITNNEADPESVVLAIAVYNDDMELVSVSFKTISAAAETEAVYATDAVTVANSTGFVKAFAWDASDNTPFGDNVEISVQ